MAHRSLEHIEQSIAETETAITLQRALMAWTPEGPNQSVALEILQDALRLKMEIRRDIQDGIG